MITLYYKEGSSDKIYQVDVEPVDGGYNVNFAYGRRGSTLTTGTKNTSPLSEADALKLADKLVNEKKAKGYTPGPDGTPYRNTDVEDRVTGIYPMLLNAISEDEIDTYILDDEWMLQEKYDGKRMMIRKDGDRVDAINRKGLIVGAPQSVLDHVAEIPGNFILDGEIIGDVYYAFDLVQPNTPLINRIYDFLALVIPNDCIVVAPFHTGYINKTIALSRLRDGGYEGVVFKKLSGLYVPGRPNSGGNALKCKFTKTVNVWVSRHNVQRSVQIALQNGTIVGNVSIPANHPVPEVATIIEVRYLYAMPGSNALYQPIFSRVRDDIDRADGLDQLKFKREED